MEDTPRPFFDHLEELRNRLLTALLFVMAATAASWFFADRVLRLLALPVGRLVFLHPTEAFFVRLKVSLGMGILVSAPAVAYQIWKFVVVALTPAEKGAFVWIFPASYVLFLAGFFFGFTVVVPAGTKFLLSYGTDYLAPMISVGEYMSFVGSICLVLGCVFQMPLVSYFASRAGLLQADWLAEKRRMAVLVIYAASAFLTPGPDPVTAILLAVPTYILYECSILAARVAKR